MPLCRCRATYSSPPPHFPITTSRLQAHLPEGHSQHCHKTAATNGCRPSSAVRTAAHLYKEGQMQEVWVWGWGFGGVWAVLLNYVFCLSLLILFFLCISHSLLMNPLFPNPNIEN